MFYWGQPQFYGVRAAAANLGNSAGNYTAEQFQEDFPQFFTGLGESLLPRTMLDEFIRQANAAIQPEPEKVSGFQIICNHFIFRYGIQLYFFAVNA